MTAKLDVGWIAKAKWHSLNVDIGMKTTSTNESDPMLN